MKWNDLTMKERSDLMSLFLKHGIGSLSDMRRIYDGEGDIEPAVITAEYPRNKEVLDIVNSSDANWVRRLKDSNRQYIQDWKDHNSIATHKMSWAEDNGKYYIYPNVQEINGRLYDFTNEKKYGKNGWRALDSALYSGDVVEVPSAADARWFTESYKNFYPTFRRYSGEENIGEETETPLYAMRVENGELVDEIAPAGATFIDLKGLNRKGIREKAKNLASYYIGKEAPEFHFISDMPYEAQARISNEGRLFKTLIIKGNHL